MWRYAVGVVLVVCGSVACLCACGDDGHVLADAAGPDAFVDPYTEIARVPVTVNRDLDLLWVIDDSPGMLDLQTRLKSGFPAFINVLNGTEGGLPNVHIGVVTSDVGTKAADDTVGASITSGPGACAGSGKGGNLQTNGSALLQGVFISDTKNTDGSRNLNYTGTLDGAMNAIASVGQTGCGFEQPLEGARRALVNNPSNTGFRRPNAHLAIVVVTDEDDCSLAHSTLLGTDTATLGPLSGFRCTRFGVTCDGGGATPDEMAQPGTKSACHSNEASAYITSGSSYTAAFGADVMFAVIAGPPSPFSVASGPALSPACMGPPTAVPAPRLASIAGLFTNNLVSSACTADLSTALTETAEHIRKQIGDPCLVRQPSTDCKVSEMSSTGTIELPMCTAGAASPVKPCYEFVADLQNCMTGNHLTLRVQRSEAPPADTVVVAKCRY